MSEQQARSEDRSERDAAGLERLFLEHLPFIEEVVAFIGGRQGLPSQEMEDFASWVKLKLIADDYAVLRTYRGESRLETYLNVVVQRLFQDYRTHLWGKFRPSAAAARMGPLAVQLEALLYRDGCDLGTAIERLAQREGLGASREVLGEIAARLPRRPRRVAMGEEALQDVGVAAEAERRIEDEERSAAMVRTSEVLREALQTIEPEDFLILKLHYRDGLTLVEIAAALGVAQRRLYYRRQRCLRQLRTALERRGLTWDRVRAMLDWETGEFSFGLAAAMEKRPRGAGQPARERSVRGE